MMHWRQLSTAEKIEAVKSTWFSGISAREIAAHFNGATRNSIIGLYGRYPEQLNQTPLKKPTKSVIAMAKANTGRNFTVRKPSTHRPSMIALEAEPFVAPEPVYEHHLCGKPMMMLGHRECRWVVNDAAVGETHLFCSMPTEKTFCEAHQARAFTKPRKTLEQLGEHLGRLG
ncbi:hypothetical protein EN866_34845 [Mesorhizobium sp. M2D.F.Ca.ET.223.01.1.1]|uniref:GcrA family cell cycle regulator n=1 Tax=Mesorhizobium sp. M2D.F.Ca.ET.223.01.1.1 TaxID=2563940 RepID=UPI001092F84F|nr:GcrA family cell cycle regulator [Mesorhizobium sp. M2D.F.Ca.ET.223.01.1.1]TGR82325.1 hypothetical protein EN866_34845 [Mesorhizobium sp. M2D.F.Ca.ET.223.01.1.1]TGT64484.1 hypothetical protein EN802_32365 [bacterium M00.F.Ca.ET.159.01.1.1]TGT79329.1 hypothetical protein EN800_31705 [bacterium M00.F.Ca.ET.157.01.1.1]